MRARLRRLAPTAPAPLAVLVLASTLVLAAAPAHASTVGLPHPAVFFPEGSDERALVDQVSGEAPTEMQDLVSYGCGGTAPLTRSCAQDLVVPGGSTVRLSLREGTGFTGTIIGTLTDAHGGFRTVTCTYLLFVADVTASPSCSTSGSPGAMVGGAMRLTGSVADASAGAVSGAPALGYWEVLVDVQTA